MIVIAKFDKEDKDKPEVTMVQEAKKNPSLVSVSDVEREARRKLPKMVLDYYRSGAGDELTLDENCQAFDQLIIWPRFLTGVANVQTSTSVLGIPIEFPVCVAPTAMQRMADNLGEIANARACAAENTVMTLSTISTSSLEEVAFSTPTSPKFFQLYIYKDRNITRELVQRAERAGFRAIVLTVDTPTFGTRYADERNSFTLPAHLRMANFDAQLKESKRLNVSEGGGSGLAEYSNSLFDPDLKWSDIAWLKSVTKLPIICKGVLTGSDAKLAVDAGCSAIWVSNHGGRQLDTVPSTIEALIEVVEAVGNRCEVYLDGGVRRGTDIFKALALGARAVFVGRPVVYGLAYDGQAGVQKVLQILKKEFKTTMALAGCRELKDIRPDMVRYKRQLLSHL